MKPLQKNCKKTKQNIIIFGASGHSSVIVDIIEKEDKYNIIGYIDSDIEKLNKKFLGYQILGTKKDLVSICKEHNTCQGLIAIGNNWKRYTVTQSIKEILPDFEFISIIHPSAEVSKRASIGSGSVIMAGSVVNSNAKIGDHCILNTGCIVEHDCRIEDYASLAPGVIVGGNVAIGNNTAVSIGAVIKNNIIIGEHTVIGAGAIVLNDISSNVVAYGVPAKFVRQRNQDDEYLR